MAFWCQNHSQTRILSLAPRSTWVGYDHFSYFFTNLVQVDATIRPKKVDHPHHRLRSFSPAFWLAYQGCLVWLLLGGGVGV
jgi:hypothetical protein